MPAPKKHHLSQAAQRVSEDADWVPVERDEEVDVGQAAPVAKQASEHMLIDGGELSEEQRLSAEVQHTIDVMKKDLALLGEVLLQIGRDRGAVPGRLSYAQVKGIVEAIAAAAEEVDAEATVVHASLPDSDAASGHVSYLLLRRRTTTRRPLEVRIAVIGNVDSGKSTMVGVLTRSMLDDGRGAARSKVFKHDHEGASGRTSAIGQHNLCLSSAGVILNDTMFKNSTCSGYVSKSAKVVTLVDLAGHERYFKTTAYGLTGHLPDYACLLVGANAGVVGMCKEHLGVALALQVPVFFVVTKVDICPEHILRQSMAQLASLLKRPAVRKRPYLVHSLEDVVTCARGITSEALAPIFYTSAVTGKGLDLLRLFINLLPQRQLWGERSKEPTEFIIDETFGVPGVGTVVAGTVKRGVLNVNTPLLIGPDIGDGTFSRISVKSIHYKRLPVSEVVAGQTAALALKKIKRDRVRKGMVLAHDDLRPMASWEFDAEISILTHATTIQPRYQAVIHCEIIRQAARVVAMDKERLRSGDRATVRFRFLQHPEYLVPGTRFVFREGRTKGIGKVANTEAEEVKQAAANGEA